MAEADVWLFNMLSTIPNSFTRMITALWQDIGLGDPLWSDQGTALLYLEGQTVELKPSAGSGQILASVDVAPLSENANQRDTEINALLKYSLLNLTVNSCAVCFEERNHTSFAVVKGLCPCEVGLTHRLSQVVVDLVYLRDECLRILAQQQKPEDQHSEDVVVSPHESLIFTP